MGLWFILVTMFERVVYQLWLQSYQFLTNFEYYIVFETLNLEF